MNIQKWQIIVKNYLENELRDMLKNLLIENKTKVLSSIIKCLKHNYHGIVVEENNKFVINIDNINRNILSQIRYLINI